METCRDPFAGIGFSRRTVVFPFRSPRRTPRPGSRRHGGNAGARHCNGPSMFQSHPRPRSRLERIAMTALMFRGTPETFHHPIIDPAAWPSIEIFPSASGGVQIRSQPATASPDRGLRRSMVGQGLFQGIDTETGPHAVGKPPGNNLPAYAAIHHGRQIREAAPPGTWLGPTRRTRLSRSRREPAANMADPARFAGIAWRWMGTAVPDLSQWPIGFFHVRDRGRATLSIPFRVDRNGMYMGVRRFMAAHLDAARPPSGRTAICRKGPGQDQPSCPCRTVRPGWRIPPANRPMERDNC